MLNELLILVSLLGLPANSDTIEMETSVTALRVPRTVMTELQQAELAEPELLIEALTSDPRILKVGSQRITDSALLASSPTPEMEIQLYRLDHHHLPGRLSLTIRPSCEPDHRKLTWTFETMAPVHAIYPDPRSHTIEIALDAAQSGVVSDWSWRFPNGDLMVLVLQPSPKKSGRPANIIGSVF